MASMKESGNIVSSDTLMNEPKKRKKKSKKLKREKLDIQKSRWKGLKFCADPCDSDLFTQWHEIKKKKKKKKPKVGMNEEIPKTENKKLKRHKQNGNSDCGLDTSAVGKGVRSEEGLQPISSSVQKDKKHKKRVVFNLMPVLIDSRPSNLLNQTQCSSTNAKPSFNAAFPADRRRSKPSMGENGTESQSTSDDVNSQDLFITQKSFSDPYIDLCSSTSAEDTQGYTESGPEPRLYTGSSLQKQSCPEPQLYAMSLSRKESCPEPQSFIESCQKTQSYAVSRPEPHSFTESLSKKQPCLEPQPYTASFSRKQSRPEPQPHTELASKKRSCPEFLSDLSLTKKPYPAYHPSPPWKPSPHHKFDVSTQTENFFTPSVLARSFQFRHCHTCTEKPMDLSLPKRSWHQHQETISKVSEDPRHPELNANDQAQSDESDSHLKGKADFSHLKVIQTRLNESFFFKLKGEGDSPKPRSPLMKLAGSGEKKKKPC